MSAVVVELGDGGNAGDVREVVVWAHVVVGGGVVRRL